MLVPAQIIKKSFDRYNMLNNRFTEQTFFFYLTNCLNLYSVNHRFFNSNLVNKNGE